MYRNCIKSPTVNLCPRPYRIAPFLTNPLLLQYGIFKNNNNKHNYKSGKKPNESDTSDAENSKFKFRFKCAWISSISLDVELQKSHVYIFVPYIWFHQ